MKLYYSPGTCSLSAHIALREAEIDFEPVFASTKTHKLKDGTDYYTINPLGYVPLLELDDGTRLTEGAAIVQYIADLAPEKNLAPANGSLPRYQMQSWLSFITSEVHKNFAPLFHPDAAEEVKAASRARILTNLKWVDDQLAGKQFLLGEQFSVADGYLFTVTNWAKFVKLDISHLENIAALRGRVASRPAVHAALKAEGLA